MRAHTKIVLTALLTGTVSVPLVAQSATYRAMILGGPGQIGGISGSNIAGGTGTGQGLRATLWTDLGRGTVDLHPEGYVTSRAADIDDNTQVGVGAINNASHALLWHRSPVGVIDLHPSGYLDSVAEGASGNDQVGWGAPQDDPTIHHALLWHGSSQSVVDLNPPDFIHSEAHGAWGEYQVGEGVQAGGVPYGAGTHALLWNGSASSFIDLHPNGDSRSTAKDAWNGMQVGQVGIQAALWYGTAASYVSLHPSGWGITSALGVSAAGQVGWGWTAKGGPPNRALAWKGSRESVTDLHQFLNVLPKTFVESYATDISDDGYIVGFAYDNTDTRYAILWSPVPEPCVSLLVTFASACTLCVRSSRR